MVLKYLAAGLIVLALLFFVFSGADWRLPGRDATIVLIALAVGFYVLSVKIDALRRD